MFNLQQVQQTQPYFDINVSNPASPTSNRQSFSDSIMPQCAHHSRCYSEDPTETAAASPALNRHQQPNSCKFDIRSLSRTAAYTTLYIIPPAAAIQTATSAATQLYSHPPPTLAGMKQTVFQDNKPRHAVRATLYLLHHRPNCINTSSVSDICNPAKSTITAL